MADQSDVIKDVGIFGLKTLVTLNSGATIVLLAFLGNTVGKEGGSISVDIGNIRCSMFLFLFGICGALLSIILTYVFAQEREELWVKNMPPRCRLSIMLVPAIFSFAFFLIGFVLAALSIG